MKHVHQIWVEGPMPEREAAWVEGVRKGAQDAGWRHTLWNWSSLQAAYGKEPIADFFARALTVLPGSTTYTLISDYYRWRVLAEEGGLYLDTDFELRAEKWPGFPIVEGLGGMAEFFNQARMCNCILWICRPQAALIAAEKAGNYLLDAIDPSSPQFATAYISLVRRDKGGLVHNGIGPGFCRKNVISALIKAGMAVRFLPETLAGHIQWGGKASLVHHGSAHWHEAPKAQLTFLWEQRACMAQRMDEEAALPIWQRPQGHSLLPERAVCPRRTSATSPSRQQWPAPMLIPKGTKRIVILSNVTNGFNPGMIPLQAGDLVLHCNHARHAEAAMAVAGTRHMLFVRHGCGRNPRGRHWYHVGGFDGFERVVFIDDASMLAPFQWFRDFRKISRKSPTTGFILANMVRELYPQMPLVLAGFEPDAKHGTPKWNGHDWQTEAAWYKERGFFLLRPKSAVRIAIIVTSCHGYKDRSIRAKGQHECYLQRRAWRKAFARMLPDNMQCAIIVGEGSAINEPRLVQLPVSDTYEGLPGKIKAAFKYAMEHFDFDWLFKCDDDTFVHFSRLAQYVENLPKGSMDIYGGPCSNSLHEICGGAGYILSRPAVELVCSDPLFPITGREDVEVCRSIIRAGGSIVTDARFRPNSKERPNAQNELITAHHMSPRQLVETHANCYFL